MTDDSEGAGRRHAFSADRPITGRTGDRLGRAAFAGALANALRSWTGRESIVVGVYGPWGVGKTSLKNLVLEDLRSTGAGPEILEFNPWEYDNLALQRRFFDQLGRALRRKDPSSGARRLAEQLRSYGMAIGVGEKVVSFLPAAVPMFLALLGVIGLGSTGLAAWLSVPVIATASTVLIVIAGLLGISRKLSQWLADMASKRALKQERTAPELKEDIARLLRKRARAVLVVMDDVDRLESAEVRRLFQLVKVNADFPNVIYLLLFQRDVVERALGQDDAQPGRKFLEKIVQVPFDVPQPLAEEIHQILIDGLNRILDPHLKERRFDKTRWANIFVPGLSGYFDSLRPVHRFLATLEFHFGLLSRTGTLEVDPIDLVAVEALRVFEPEVHGALRGAKDLLTKEDPLGERESAPRKEAVFQIVNRAEESHRPGVKEILSRLFPTIEWVFGGSHYGGTIEQEWERDLRVCSSAFFDRYFRLDIPVRDLSQADLLPLLSPTAAREELSDHFRSLEKRGLLPLVFSRLEAHKETRNHANAAAFVTAIFDVGDLLPVRAPSFDIDPIIQASRIVLWFLRSDPDSTQRQTVLKEAIGRTTGLILPVEQVALEEPREDKSAPSRDKLIQEDELPVFRALCLEKIETAARNGTLLANPHLVYLFFQWKRLGDPSAVREWAGTTVSDPARAILLLERFVQISGARGLQDYTMRTRSYIDLRAIETFVDVDLLKEAVASLDVSGLSREGKHALELFGRALQRRAEGKSDDPHAGFPGKDEWD